MNSNDCNQKFPAPKTPHTAHLSVVGAGPGDPDLITLKAIKALKKADVILYDALANEELLDYAPPLALRIFVGKRRGFKRYGQDEINEMIVQYALQYGRVVRLKGGDPFLFGRGMEEIIYAEAQGISTEYVPGITSAVGVPGLAGIPVTHRGASESFWVVTATTENGELSKDLAFAIQSNATVIILMGTAKLAQIVECFLQAGKAETPIAIVQNGSLPNQKAVIASINTILPIAKAFEIDAPAVIVIGDVVSVKDTGKTIIREIENHIALNI